MDYNEALANFEQTLEFFSRHLSIPLKVNYTEGVDVIRDVAQAPKQKPCCCRCRRSRRRRC